MDIFDLTVPQLTRTLRNIDLWLTTAEQHANGEALLTARLASDQFTFTRQIQIACDNAKMLCGRLAGKEWPAHPDTETTYAQLHARIASVIDYLAGFSRADFATATERKVRLPWMPEGQHLTGTAYLVEFGLPNFYFHVVTAYSILRHQGLPMGKGMYIGQLSVVS